MSHAGWRPARLRRILSLGTVLGLAMTLAGTAYAAPQLTTIQDTLFNADGTLFNGSISITWPAFTAADLSAIGAQTLTVPVANGFFSVQLVPTTNAVTPAQYTAVFESAGKNQFTETWGVPASATPLRIQDVLTSATGQVVGGGGGGGTQITINDVVGLSAELSLRPTIGSSFAVGRTAIIDALGEIDGASGNASDCVHVDGSSGACGGSASGPIAFSDNEIPGGAINGTNAVFTLSNAPAPATSLSLFRNGMLLRPSLDYTLNSAAITFGASAIPQTGDYLQASYRYGGTLPGVTFVDQETPSGAIDGVNGTFTLANTPNPSSVADGLSQRPAHDAGRRLLLQRLHDHLLRHFDAATGRRVDRRLPHVAAVSVPDTFSDRGSRALGRRDRSSWWSRQGAAGGAASWRHVRRGWRQQPTARRHSPFGTDPGRPANR